MVVAIPEKVLADIRSRENRNYDVKAEYTVLEYCGIQRSGKTTLMVADLVNKLIVPRSPFGYVPDEVHANFKIFIPGVHCWNNEQMLEILLKAKKERWRHKVYMIDECSQPPLFYARNAFDKLQTELVTSLWQMPKLGCTCQWSGNIGNSVDVQQRDATWYTIYPYHYYHCQEDRSREYIDYSVFCNYERWLYDETYNYPAQTQELFDSFSPVE